MELATVRAAILSGFERLGETQETFAIRAGLRQGHLAKLLDLDQPMTELRARVLFSLIEKGLGTSLSSFFAQIEGIAAGAAAAPLAVEGSPNAPAPVASSPVDLVAFSALVTALGRSLINEFFERADRQRQAQSRARKKPRRRTNVRGDARRRG